ncbi:Heat shock protein ssb1 [Pleosporales sp. CAS-2024a]
MSDEVYEGAIGIDLGTTYSCVANYEGTNVEIIANEQGSFTTPSFVSFTSEERLIGEAAKNQAAMNPENTVFDVKRLIGRRFEDETVTKDIKSWPFKVVDQGGSPMIEVSYLGETKQFSAQEISAMVLVKMKEVAETKLGKKVEKAVITVPAYFNDNQRQATKDAGAIAGLNVLRIINEPTAAAIAYGLGSGKSEKERNVLIYDLGGGTFDVSLLHIQGGVFTVKATAGDTHLGGSDFDTALLDHFKKEYQKRFKKGKYLPQFPQFPIPKCCSTDVDQNRQDSLQSTLPKPEIDMSGDARALRRLRTACERAKRTLSNATQTTVEIDSLFDGDDFNANITRARFEDLNQKAFTGTLEPVAQVLKDANIAKEKVDEIVLVGGSTRIPKIQKLLSDFFGGKKLEKSINPDEAVAYGAAVQAGILSGKATSAETADLLLLDVVPLSLGVAMEGNIFAPVVPRGQTVPTIKKRTFTTVADNQQTVQFPVFQGERVNCEDNTSLGEFTLAPIPPMRAGEAVLEVVFEVDVNGILKVTATEKTSGRSANITISNAVGKLSSTEIENMINDAQKFKTSDEAFSKKFEGRQQLESYISRVEEMVSDPTTSIRLKRGQKEKIESALSDAMAQLEVEDASAEDLKKKELALKRVVTKAFSTR